MVVCQRQDILPYLHEGEANMNIKRFELTPDSTVSFQGNPAIRVFVWPLRARLLLWTAQLTRYVRQRELP